MRVRIVFFLILSSLFFLFGCPAYHLPYLSLDLKTVYTTPDITVNYTYVCEEGEQRCVYNLYDKAAPSVAVVSADDVFPQTGSISFTGLKEGEYRFEFSVYTTKDGTSSLLKFLDEDYDFTVDFP